MTFGDLSQVLGVLDIKMQEKGRIPSICALAFLFFQ